MKKNKLVYLILILLFFLSLGTKTVSADYEDFPEKPPIGVLPK